MQYLVSFPQPSDHYAEVVMTVPEGTGELMAAVWTPGSYLVREYARNIDAVRAENGSGQPVSVTKTSKNHWKLGPGAHTVRYRVYAREMSVRTNWVEPDFAFLTGAATFLTVPGHLVDPVEVGVSLPAGWTSLVTSLDRVGENRFRAADFDELVDSPILAGSPVISRFEVSGKEHVLATLGAEGQWDLSRAAQDVEKIVRAQEAMWGSLPYPRYVFLNLLTEARGGLEHKNSTVLMGSRFAGRTREDYLKWLLLVSHEYFHVWNVKRLRPVELGPFDYEGENYTPSLWIAEGFTAYYEPVLLRRAGLMNDKELLKEIQLIIEAVEHTPGREVQSVRDSSYDAWIKFYRPNENSVNSVVSYYDKGAAIAFLLDARIRQETGGEKSLDDVMRLAYSRYGEGKPGYTEQQFIDLISEVAGTDLAPLIHQMTATTEPLDYEPALRYFGLKRATREAPPEGEAEPAWLGAKTRVDGGRLVVVSVPRDTPAFVAGLDAEDEIVGIGGFRVVPEKLDDRLKQLRVGEKTELLVARRGKLLPLAVTLGSKPGSWKLEIDSHLPGEARQEWVTGARVAPVR